MCLKATPTLPMVPSRATRALLFLALLGVADVGDEPTSVPTVTLLYGVAQ